LVLEKSFLEAIPVYWMSFSWIPKGVMKISWKLHFKFILDGTKNQFVSPWVKWKEVAFPKTLGGWGLKNIFLFPNPLEYKSCWILITSYNL